MSFVKPGRILVIPWAYGAGMDDATRMRPLFRAFGAWMDRHFLMARRHRDDDVDEEEVEIAFATPFGMPMQPAGLDRLVVSEWIRDDGGERVSIFTTTFSFCIDECVPSRLAAQFSHIVFLKCPSVQRDATSPARWQVWETFERSLVMMHASVASTFDSDVDVIVHPHRTVPSTKRTSLSFHTPPWTLVDT